jgi:glyoxylase-like metal-dependent hydrolase (beta-lactamase superfamily II)
VPIGWIWFDQRVSAAHDLGGDVWSFQAPLWQTNALLAVSRGDALLCDPAITPDQIAAIAGEARRRADRGCFVLVTHADYDHVCGIPYFPAAEVVAGTDTAAKVSDGSARRGLESGGVEWGLEWPLDLRVDRAVAAGELQLGAFRVVAVDAPSHGREGLAYVLPEQGILLPGDSLSAITIPLLAGSLARARVSAARLLETLDRYALRHVVPGHGPVLAPGEARRIGEQDLRYLDGLDAAAREAVRDRLSPGDALVHVYGVESPRPSTTDFAIYDIHGGNVRLALREHGFEL